MFVLGLDENGLGPLLGPMVTTAVGFEMSRYTRDRQARLGRTLGIDDSKNTAAFGRMDLAEGLALAACEALRGSVPSAADELFDWLLLDPPATLKARCPTSSFPQCWSAQPGLPCFGGDVDRGRAALSSLRAKGLSFRYVKSAVACTRHLNDALAAGQSRVELDLELMERLVLDARGGLREDLRAICGMVGGIRSYRDKMRHIARERLRPQRAGRGTIAYAVEGVGDVRFEIDADERHLPVALASMIGKYVRELWMLRHNRFYQGHDATLGEASGYHDPVTKRFIASSSLVRKRLRVDDACFVRDSAKGALQKRQLELTGLCP